MCNTFHIVYHYQNVRILNASNKELEFHIHINDRRWRELMNNEDLRFFKHGKTMLNDVLKNNDGNILRIGSWDSIKLMQDYTFSKRCKHINLIKYNCYFEYEMDIVNYLCYESNESNEYPEDQIYESAVIIKPYFTPLKEFCDKDVNENASLLKQILLTMFLLFFKYHIGFENIDLNNMSVKKEIRLQNIVYDIGNKCLSIKSKNIVKIDEYRNMVQFHNLNANEYKTLNKNIKNVLEQFNKIHPICLINKDVTDKESSVNMLEECFKEIEKHIL